MARTARIVCMLILLMGPLGLRGVHACGGHGRSVEHACGHHTDAADHDHHGEPRKAPAERCDHCDMLAQQQLGSVTPPPPAVPSLRAGTIQPACLRVVARTGVLRETLAQPPPVG